MNVGDQVHFSYCNNYFAVVAFLFNQFTGDIFDTFGVDEGRWIVIVTKLNNCLFLVCNIYGHNCLGKNHVASALFQG